jgi:haloalkane dehalogenase
VPAILRTPDERFRHLSGFPFEPRYLDCDGARMHYVDEGPRDGETLLCLHGEPTWCYLSRRMIPTFAAAGYRVIAPDWIGFGRSDKYASIGDYSYEGHIRSLELLVRALELDRVTPVVQDWGGLIGLPWSAENEDRVARLVILNTALPTGEHDPGLAFRAWRSFACLSPSFPVGRIVRAGLARPADPAVLAAYDAPFPSRAFRVGARAFPRLVPTSPADAGAKRNRAAKPGFARWRKPVYLCFGRQDPVFGREGPRLRDLFPGSTLAWIDDAGHFVQEDAGEEVAQRVPGFLERTAERSTPAAHWSDH